MIEDIFEEFERRLRRMERLLDNLTMPEIRELENFKIPLADLREKDGKFVIEIELPGVKKEDIHITATEREIEVKASFKKEVKEERKGYLRRERRYEGFYRKFVLPEEIDVEKIKATYENGILRIEAEKKVKEGKKKEVKVE